jgi:hypothetical protein
MRFKDKRVLQIQTVEDMMTLLEEKGNPLSDYKKGTVVRVHDKMQKGYSYVLQEAPGKNLVAPFELTPKEMLSAGIFEGKYLNDCLLEFPKEWFEAAIKRGKLSPEGPRPEVNQLGVKSRLPLDAWEEKGWIPSNKGVVAKQHPELSDPALNHDPRGWFQWYCRYWMGRREPEIDAVQLKRWFAFKRHVAQVRINCKKGDLSCRPVQRQALLQWAYDPES